MADTKISGLAELTVLAPDDELVIVDKSDTTQAASGTTKRIKAQTVLPIVVRKSADETVNNSNVLQDDNHLTLPVLASSVYQFELQLLLSAANATADWQIAWTVPAGATMLWGRHTTSAATSPQWDLTAVGVTQIALWDATTVAPFGSGAVTGGAYFRGVIRVGGTAGNAQFRWAQNTADVSDSKVLTDSVLIARKIA